MAPKSQNKTKSTEVTGDGAAAAVAVMPPPAPVASTAAPAQPKSAKRGRGKKNEESSAPAEKSSEKVVEKTLEKADKTLVEKKSAPVAEEKAEKAEKAEKEEKTAKPAKNPRRKNVLAVRPETVPESNPEVKPRAPRRVPTRETVQQEFEDLVKEIETEIVRLKASQAKSKGVKFLLTVNKKVKALSGHALRLAKEKKVVKRDNANSGFRKPVPISPELAKFIGWNPSELHSRTEVTRFFCDYIQKNNLKNPEDGRQIMVENDPKLKKLLKYDSSKDSKPLTYYSLQAYLKDHYVKTPPAAAAATPVPAATPAKKA